MEEAKPKAALKGLAEGAAPSFPSGSKAPGVGRHLPSGNDEHSYGKCPFIVDFPMENGDFP